MRNVSSYHFSGEEICKSKSFKTVFLYIGIESNWRKPNSKKNRIPSHLDYWFPDMQHIMHKCMQTPTQKFFLWFLLFKG